MRTSGCNFKKLKVKISIFALVFSCEKAFGSDFEAIVACIKAGTSLVGSAYNTGKDIADKIRESSERRRFEQAIRGGFSVYLQEDKSSRNSVRPLVVPFSIDVIRATVRSQDGVLESDNATRSAKGIFNGELEEKTLVRKRKFMRDEFGCVKDPAPGQRKLLDVWYRCLDDRKVPVSGDRHAQAHEMNNIELSCKDVPSVYKGKFGN